MKTIRAIQTNRSAMRTHIKRSTTIRISKNRCLCILILINWIRATEIRIGHGKSTSCDHQCESQYNQIELLHCQLVSTGMKIKNKMPEKNCIPPQIGIVLILLQLEDDLILNDWMLVPLINIFQISS